MSSQVFDRPLHMVLGLPFDALRMAEVVPMLHAIPSSGKRWFVSTPNLNFLMAAQSSAEFRQSVLDSELVLADGMPIIWIARILGIPLPERVPGSGLIETLRKGTRENAKPLKIFFFGGEPGLAGRACERLNAESGGLTCVGAIDPGYGSVSALSDPSYIETINAARPDFLILALGAAKGQAWIVANRAALEVPIVAHLGAVIKFVAGDVARAPALLQRFGLEWLWRIREEPALWRRYAADGSLMAWLLLTRVLPLAVSNRLHRPPAGRTRAPVCDMERQPDGTRLARLRGRLCIENIAAIREALNDIAAAGEAVVLDFSAVRHIDSAFLGQFCMLWLLARSKRFDLHVRAVPRHIRHIFRWSLCEYLLLPPDTAPKPAGES